MSTLRPWHHVLAAATIVVGLAVDMRVDAAGQLAVSLAVWAVLLYLLRQIDRGERRTLFACLIIATAGEIVLSLGWGLYTYRLDNVPYFVPPGHVLMLILGISLARQISQRIAVAVIGAALLFATATTLSGIDSFAAALALLLFIVSVALPAHRPLYASTFVLALALELYGTWLGNWTWSAAVPALGLTTTNPPVLAGAFYAALDAIVLATMVLLMRCGRRAQGSQPLLAATTANIRS
jgi:hypothetical protein